MKWLAMLPGAIVFHAGITAWSVGIVIDGAAWFAIGGNHIDNLQGFAIIVMLAGGILMAIGYRSALNAKTPEP
ncbi:hypothetical protein Mal4_05040 [Maioricimonas rarisocia]|uniref:Uncharacterized protein n=1 Tax=Maioricimonas rarisocia TaxID=2528026 RepID=A0A517Z157_9PLAN|nr:hypothetical protein [Maioricimonas rarisocia]QDU36220.1 hypothetical protein Mal4_05040 [Maioricimonas rarisocia]